jgi:hypothetical protein
MIHSLTMARQTWWIQTVVSRVCVFLFSLFLISFLLFLLGNLQEFLDSTQLVLLRVSGAAAFFYVVATIYFIVIAVAMAIRRLEVGWYRVVLAVIGLLLAAGVLLFTNFLRSWIEQVR